MLDLKKLEEKLDKALANETEESIEAWLLEQRKKEIEVLIDENAYLAGGTVSQCELGTSSVSFSPALTTPTSISVEVLMPFQYGNAA